MSTENKRKHLEFIQNVITRMNTNSFLVKGWAVTLVTGLFALAAKESNIKFVSVSLIVIPAFWILDGFYIATENRYRDLYDKVARKLSDNEITFSMDASCSCKLSRTWIGGIFSKTLIPFYGILVIAVFIVKKLIT